jgi:hypothetical protein
MDAKKEAGCDRTERVEKGGCMDILTKMLRTEPKGRSIKHLDHTSYIRHQTPAERMEGGARAVLKQGCALHGESKRQATY